MKSTLSAQHVPLPGMLRHDLNQRVESAFRRFETRVSYIRVTLRDVDGPEGGDDILCRLEAVWWGENVIIEELADNPATAVAQACSRGVHTLSRRLDKMRSRRRRTAPELVA